MLSLQGCRGQPDVDGHRVIEGGKRLFAGSGQVFRNEGSDSLRRGHPEPGVRLTQPYTSCCDNLHANTTMLPD